MNHYFKLTIVTTLIFALLTFISTLIHNTTYGFPFWFYKQACSVSINIETGQEFGETSAFSGLNLALDVLVALTISWLGLWILKISN